MWAFWLGGSLLACLWVFYLSSFIVERGGCAALQGRPVACLTGFGTPPPLSPMWYKQLPGALPFLSGPSNPTYCFCQEWGRQIFQYFCSVLLGTVWGKDYYWASRLLLLWQHTQSCWGLFHGPFLFLSLHLLTLNLSSHCSYFVKKNYSAHGEGCRFLISNQSELFQWCLICPSRGSLWFSSIAIDLFLSAKLCVISRSLEWEWRQACVLSSLSWSNRYRCIVETLCSPFLNLLP